MKAISTYVATIIILIITLATGFIIYVWYYGLLQRSGSEVEKVGEASINCQFGSLNILMETLKCSDKYLNFSLKNSGFIDLYDIKVIIFDGQKVYTLEVYDLENNKLVTKENPLKPLTAKNFYVNISGLGISNILSLEILTQCTNINIKIKDKNISCT